MQKAASSLAWGLTFGLVVFFIISRGGATPPPALPKHTAQGQPTKAAASHVPKSHPAPKSSTPTKTARNLPPFLVGLTIFLLAIFIGFELISKVPSILHSPLMSGANAISGVTIVGALVCASSGQPTSFAALLGFLGVICAMINVVGGFLVTDRMLQMYIKKK